MYGFTSIRFELIFPTENFLLQQRNSIIRRYQLELERREKSVFTEKMHVHRRRGAQWKVLIRLFSGDRRGEISRSVLRVGDFPPQFVFVVRPERSDEDVFPFCFGRISSFTSRPVATIPEVFVLRWWSCRWWSRCYSIESTRRRSTNENGSESSRKCFRTFASIEQKVERAAKKCHWLWPRKTTEIRSTWSKSLLDVTS